MGARIINRQRVLVNPEYHPDRVVHWTMSAEEMDGTPHTMHGNFAVLEDGSLWLWDKRFEHWGKFSGPRTSNPEGTPAFNAGYSWYLRKYKTAKGSFSTEPGALQYLKKQGLESTKDLSRAQWIGHPNVLERIERAQGIYDDFLNGANRAHEDRMRRYDEDYTPYRESNPRITVEKAMDKMPGFMSPEGVPDRVQTWDDLLYQTDVEIDIAETGELGWTPRQLAIARRYRKYVEELAGRAAA